MARFTVVWDPDVEAAFVAHWVAGDSQTRATLTEIANWVDANLAEDPDVKGQARDDLEARIVPVPLSSSTVRVSVSYEVWPDDRRVHVIRLTMKQ